MEPIATSSPGRSQNKEIGRLYNALVMTVLASPSIPQFRCKWANQQPPVPTAKIMATITLAKRLRPEYNWETKKTRARA
jgi:hypothetical protein